MKDFFSFSFKSLDDKDEGKWIPHVRRDWTSILCIATVVMTSFLVFHFFFYFSMTARNFFSREDTSVSSVPDRVDQKKLTAVLLSFQQKKENFDAIIKNPVLFSDPSIASGAVVSKNHIATSTDSIDLSQ